MSKHEPVVFRSMSYGKGQVSWSGFASPLELGSDSPSSDVMVVGRRRIDLLALLSEQSAARTALVRCSARHEGNRFERSDYRRLPSSDFRNMGSTGFIRSCSKPAAIALSQSSCRLEPVIAKRRVLRSAGSRHSCRHTSWPFMSGSPRSTNTTSGMKPRASLSADAPLIANRTSCPMSCNTSAMDCTWSMLSSTTMMRYGRDMAVLSVIGLGAVLAHNLHMPRQGAVAAVTIFLWRSCDSR